MTQHDYIVLRDERSFTQKLNDATSYGTNDAFQAALEQAMDEFKKYHPDADVTDPDIQTVYVAGKMSGIKGFGFKKFDDASADLRERGYLVLSPAEMDDPSERKHAMESPDGKISRSELPRAHFLKRDYLIVCEIDMMIVLPDWKDSEGAMGETLIGFSLDKPVLAYPNLEQLTWADHPYSQYWSSTARRDLEAMMNTADAPMIDKWTD